MCMRRLIASLMLLYVAAGEARAHSWYTELYSGRGEHCCGLDCGPLNPVFFRHEPDGMIDEEGRPSPGTLSQCRDTQGHSKFLSTLRTRATHILATDMPPAFSDGRDEMTC